MALTVKGVQEQVAALNAEAKSIADKFNSWSDQVEGEIRKILVEAGISDQVDALNKERASVREEAMGKVNAIQSKVQELNTVLKYLSEEESRLRVSREQAPISSEAQVFPEASQEAVYTNTPSSEPASAPLSVPKTQPKTNRLPPKPQF